VQAAAGSGRAEKVVLRGAMGQATVVTGKAKVEEVAAARAVEEAVGVEVEAAGVAVAEAAVEEAAAAVAEAVAVEEAAAVAEGVAAEEAEPSPPQRSPASRRRGSCLGLQAERKRRGQMRQSPRASK
jgi:hypothetical protein